MTPGRPPNTPPATAYDYRHHIELTQVLALNNWKAVLALCDAWGVAPVIIQPPDGSRYYYDNLETIARLAQHCTKDAPA